MDDKRKSQNSAEGKRAQVISRIQSHHQKHNIFQDARPINVLSRAARAHDIYVTTTHTHEDYDQLEEVLSSHHLTMDK
jgi:hypothetical protein